MSIRECIIRAADAKEIDNKQAKRLTDLYDDMSAEMHMAGLPIEESAIARQMAEIVKAENALTKRRELLALSAVDRIKVAVQAGVERGHSMGESFAAILENFREIPFQSVVEKRKAIIGLARAEMHEIMNTFERSWLTGVTPARAMLDDVVRELHGVSTGNQRAAAMAGMFAQVAEGLRQRFNAAGGAIAKLDGWAIPHSHDAGAMFRAGKAAWVAFIDKKLDRHAMVDPLTKQPFTDRGWQNFLEKVWDRATTNGDVDLMPGTQQGSGAVASRYTDHRVLKFKSADDWMAYDKEFGTGNAFVAMNAYIETMARDIALMEVLGPNPASVIRWMQDEIRKDRAQQVARGVPGVDPKDASDEWLLANLYDDVSGAAYAPVRGRAATIWSALRQFTNATKLAGAVLSTPSDFGNQALARAFLGLSKATFRDPITGVVKGFFQSVFDSVAALSSASRDEMLKAGLAFDRTMTVAHREASRLHAGDSPLWAQWLADRTVTYSGLLGLTRAQREGFGMAMLNGIDQLRTTPWHMLDQVAPGLRKAFEDYGLTAADWAVIQQVQTNGAVLTPKAVSKIDRAVAERLLGIILQETEFATFARVHRSTAGENMLGWAMNGERGTFGGELSRSMGQLKSFTLGMVMLQGLRSGQIVAESGSRFKGASYLTGWLIAITSLGAVSVQLKEMARGKDPRDMDDARFWGEAFMQGGGMGILGDFIRSETNRMGDGLAGSLAGPLIGSLSPVADLALTTPLNWWNDKDVNPGRQVRRLLSNNTPVLPWYLRAAYERGVLDNLQRLIDPDAQKAFRDQRRKTEREYEQEWWWEPGKSTPARAPDLGAAFGN